MTNDCRYSPYLVACYDSINEEYQSVCRVMSGFTDAFYREVYDPSKSSGLVLNFTSISQNMRHYLFSAR